MKKLGIVIVAVLATVCVLAQDKPRRGGEIVVLLQWVSRESLSRNLPVYQKVIYYGNQS